MRVNRTRDDRGLTLIELLVTIAILGVIAVPLSAALITYFQHTDETNQRLSLSHDSQIAAAYFAQDVVGMGIRNWGDPGFPLVQSVYRSTSGPAPCGTGDQLVMRLLRDDPTEARGTAGVLAVAYWVRTVGGQKQLARVECAADHTVKSDVVVAHNLDSVDPPSCGPVACTDPSVPQTVTLVLHLRSPSLNSSDSLIVTLAGQRRDT
jgi:prepilin-type N-terminal cleavage/methylation domain-containing protein